MPLGVNPDVNNLWEFAEVIVGLNGMTGLTNSKTGFSNSSQNEIKESRKKHKRSLFSQHCSILGNDLGILSTKEL